MDDGAKGEEEEGGERSDYGEGLREEVVAESLSRAWGGFLWDPY